MRQAAVLSAALALAVGLAGCRHRPVLSPLPDLVPLSGPAPLPPPRRRPAPASRDTEPATPTQVATNDAAAAALTIGALSLGGEAAHTPQQAQDLINAVLKRIAGISAQVASAEKREIGQARNYLDQAQKALKAGDAEGAHTLATKASLLMDEVEKK